MIEQLSLTDSFRDTALNYKYLKGLRLNRHDISLERTKFWRPADFCTCEFSFLLGWFHVSSLKKSSQRNVLYCSKINNWNAEIRR